MGGLSSFFMASRQAGKLTRQRERFDLVGGIPRKRLRFVYMTKEGVLKAVAWDAITGEVRTIPGGEYVKLEDES